MSKRPNQRYILAPCSGRKKLNIARGHVYRVYDTEGVGFSQSEGKDLGTISREEAIEQFGESTLFFSESDSLCYFCNKEILKDIADIALGT